MRLKSRALTRSWLVLAAAVVTALPATTAAVAAVPAAPAPLPHAVGGYLPGAVRTAAKPALGPATASEVLPASVDLRQYAPAVGDQGQIGACVAWTIGYSIMGYYANRTGGVGAPYAPLYLYLRNVVRGGAPTAGLNPDAVLANAQLAGVDTQDDYWQGTTNWQTPPTAAQIDNAKNYRVDGWSRLFNGPNQGTPAQTAIMQALASGSPVALGMPVYRDFMYLRSHSVYSTLLGTNLGGHMVAAYGYDAQGVWIRNSWGTGWGNGGDAKLSWAFVTRVVNGGYAVNGITTPAVPIPMAPTVGALSTVKAPPGASVTITGAGLSTATEVSFGGTAATFTPQTVNGLSKLVAVAPAHAPGPVDVTVTNATGTSIPGLTSRFTYLPPVPGITALSPDSVTMLGGTPVTLTGTSLTGVTTVKLGTTAVSAKVLNPTTLTFVAPVRATPGPVTVTVSTVSGTSTPAGLLTYVAPPAPVITSVTPGSGPTYKSTPVVITGTDFAGATRVLLGDRALSFTRISATQLRVTVPGALAGERSLRVVTPGGTSAVDTAGTFTHVAPSAPVITSIVPAEGLTFVRTPVVVTGENFTDSTRLTLGGVLVSYTRVSATQLKVTLPAHPAGPVDLQITTPGGLSALGTDTRFTYRTPPVPVITALSVSSTPTRVTTPLTVTGTGFTGASRVFVGTVSVAFTKVSDTQLRLTLPARTTAGDAPVTVVTPGGTSGPAPFAFIGAPLPAVSQLLPAYGTANQTAVVFVKGSGFTGATRLALGGVGVPFVMVSDTTLKVTLPARAAGSYGIVVVGPGGSSVAGSAAFQYRS